MTCGTTWLTSNDCKTPSDPEEDQKMPRSIVQYKCTCGITVQNTKEEKNKDMDISRQLQMQLMENE
jgi:hypothetical protein